jgi:hypothetical protein
MNIMSDGSQQDFARWVAFGGDKPTSNPILAAGMRQTLLVPFAETDVISGDERTRHPLWQEFYEPLDMPHIATNILNGGAAGKSALTAIRSRKQGHFTQDDLHLIEVLGHSWRTALMVNNYLSDAALAIASAALNNASISALIVDGFSRVHCLTPAAESMIKQGIISVIQGRLSVPGNDSATKKLENAHSASISCGQAQEVLIDLTEYSSLSILTSRIPDSVFSLNIFRPILIVIKRMPRLSKLTSAER